MVIETRKESRTFDEIDSGDTFEWRDLLMMKMTPVGFKDETSDVSAAWFNAVVLVHGTQYRLRDDDIVFPVNCKAVIDE